MFWYVMIYDDAMIMLCYVMICHVICYHCYVLLFWGLFDKMTDGNSKIGYYRAY